jgi:hypothetical protein
MQPFERVSGWVVRTIMDEIRAYHDACGSTRFFHHFVERFPWGWVGQPWTRWWTRPTVGSFVCDPETLDDDGWIADKENVEQVVNKGIVCEIHASQLKGLCIV